MKIVQIVNKQLKGKNEIYNDGNKKYKNVEETKYVEHSDFNKEDGYYFNINPKLNSEINKSLGNIHEKTIVEEIPQENGKIKYKQIKTSGDTSFDPLKNPYFKHELKEPENNKNNYIKDSSDVDINYQYLNNAKNISEKAGAIKSNIDGQTDWTNIQDTNISGVSGKDFGISLAKEATTSLGPTLGIDNSDVNDIVGSFKNVFSKDLSSFDENMNKLNSLKHDNFKEIHVFDWKPGQVVEPELAKSDLANMVKDVGNLPFIPKGSRNNFNKGFKKVTDIISPDPLKKLRDSLKPLKGINDDGSVKAEDIGIQNDVYGAELVAGSDSGSISVNWSKNSNFFDGFNKSEKETRIINALKNKNTFNKILGSIYIRPNSIYNSNNKLDEGGVKNLEIPFEFNPEISEGGTQANYATETLMNRIGQFNIYTGTNLPSLSINLSYMALAPDEIDDEDHAKMSKQFSTDSWQYYWTNNRIEEIEYKLRSLVLPDVTSKDYLIKPPLIEIHLGNPTGEGADSVGDLFKYPIGIFNEEAGNNNVNNYLNDQKMYLATSRTINDGNSNEGINRYKKYIVTSVQISNFNDDSFIWPSLYGRAWQNGKSGSPINHLKASTSENKVGFSGYTRRTGFKATLQCVEVVENFLDIVPDFKAYYNAWNYKGAKADITSEYAKIMTNEGNIQETADLLDASINSSIANIASLNDRLDASFKEAFTIASLYKQTKTKSKRISLFNSQSIGDSSSDKEGYYYFANPNWVNNLKSNSEISIIEETSEDQPKKETIEEILNKPIYFKIELPIDMNNFFNKLNNENKWTDANDQCDNIVAYNPNTKSENITINKNILSENNIYNDNFPLKDKNYLLLKEEENYNKIAYMPNNEKIKNNFSDIECYYLIYYLSNMYETYKDKINTINNDYLNNTEDRKKYSRIKIYNTLYNDDAKEIDFIKEQEEFIKELVSTKGYISELLESFKKIHVTYQTPFDKEKVNVKLNIKKIYLSKSINFDDILKEVDKAYDLQYISQLTLINNNSNIFNELTKDIYKQAEKDKAISKSQLKSILKEINKLIEKYYDSLRTVENTINNIILFNNSSFISIEEVIKSIQNSIVDGNYINKILSEEIQVECEIYNGEGEKNNIFNKKIEVYYVEKSDIKAISINYIVNKINEEYKRSIRQMNNLEKDLKRFPINNSFFKKYFDNLNEVNSIIFDKEKNNLDLSECKNLIENILGLKISLNAINLQKMFTKVAGYDEETFEKIKKDNNNLNYPVVPELKTLEKGYEEYSENEDAIRKLAFDAFEKALEKGNTKIGNNYSLDKDWSNQSDGIIPNGYYNINKAKELKNKMQVAGLSMNHFEKLS